ncbi:conserved hypothetical protein [uncultured Paludibacter sp.]|uniref:Transposase IS200-like domain-containing protein n=1 Tax=uncultured Paludibacter sp. TaxID=497635 RepID=A0A653AK68_9BACT|nr:conserved hypothetical protein [uncultured Paludibacter sp.]
MKKEAYRGNLPHFQQPGQDYFVTWILKGAVPKKAVEIYSKRMEELKNEIDILKRNNADFRAIETAKKDYYIIRKKYITQVDEILDAKTDNIVDLSKPDNLKIIYDTLTFWGGKRIGNYCFCVMPNHIHWVLRVFEKDDKGKPVYLEEIMHSVKLFTARQINILENRTGILWNKESFDTTIRDTKHLYNAIEYTLNNPLKAKLVKEKENWRGTFDFERD